MIVGSAPSFQHLLTELGDTGVLEVTIDRPYVLNAWNEALITDLLDLWTYADRADEVRVVLLTGAGSAFSVGGDIDFLEQIVQDTDWAARGTIKRYVDMMRGMMDLDKPIIAAINGHVIGGGAGVALMCDVTFMSDRARILCGGQLNIACTPAEATFFWPLLMSMAKAKYHLFQSTFIGAAEAERIGLVSVVTPHDELMETARAYAEKISKRDAVSLGWTKRTLNHWLRDHSSILDFALATEAISFRRPAVVEGLKEMRVTLKQDRPGPAAD
jgi:enoyl-CoA hydratase